MEQDNYLIVDSLPDITPQNDRVVIMRDRFLSISNNYKGMLYFCSNVLDVPRKNVNMLMLKQFDIRRFQDNERFKRNLSWPVDYYLKRIKELEQKIIELGGEI